MVPRVAKGEAYCTNSPPGRCKLSANWLGTGDLACDEYECRNRMRGRSAGLASRRRPERQHHRLCEIKTNLAGGETAGARQRGQAVSVSIYVSCVNVSYGAGRARACTPSERFPENPVSGCLGPSRRAAEPPSRWAQSRSGYPKSSAHSKRDTGRLPEQSKPRDT
jgi:hypothetical protein